MRKESEVRSQKSEARAHAHSGSCLLPPVSRSLRGFVLLEAMVAVATFALGVLALGKCVSSCVAAEIFKQEHLRARQALDNRMAEIESGAVLIKDATTEELKAPFDGMKLKQTSVPLKLKNEKEQDITGISAVTLEVSWQSGADTAVKDVTFYVYPRQQ